MWIAYDRPQQLAEMARHARARYVSCSAVQLAGQLPRLAPGPAAAPPATGNDTLERYQPAGRTWEPATLRLGQAADGLYRLRAAGRRRFLLRRGDGWYRTTHAELVL